MLLYYNHRHLSGVCTPNDYVHDGTFHNEEQIKAIAYRAQNKITKDITILLRGGYSFEAVVDTYLYWLKKLEAFHMSRLRKRKTRITDIHSLLDLTWAESFHSFKKNF